MGITMRENGRRICKMGKGGIHEEMAMSISARAWGDCNHGYGVKHWGLLRGRIEEEFARWAREASLLYSDRNGMRQFRRNSCSLSGEVKKQGQSITKEHKKHASLSLDLKLSDFDPKEKFWTRFPPQGSKITPSHQSLEFR
ncbi:unnamed protein product [Fraxinus pennsylvanica]|uniref:Uncharacterized protein n=1 Tax=Fraxinus pennsylvanica TaxID=56036 RepID=A0AAD2DKY1_9LAMI|nr:unnamed protein product [Fraxinus pennsylvanica]